MPNIDVSTIQGFDAMSADEKVSALLAYEIPENVDMTKYVSKETFDKKASEAAKLARDLKAVPDISSIRADLEKAQTDLVAANMKAEQIARENLLYSRGITDPEDVKYYAYRIGQMVTAEKPFEKATEEFFKDNKPHGAARVDLSPPLAGSNSKKTANEVMNALIRGANK